MWINYRVLARLLTALLTLATATSNPGPQQRIHQEIRQIYTFQPHLLGPQELQQKSAILDQFWAKVKSNRTAYIPALRQELADLSNPPFFLYDGSRVLLAVSDTPSDRKVALAAIAHCDLSDVQTKDYFYQVHRLATLNEDTTAAAFHVLEDPGYRVFVPQHVLTLGQNYVVIYLLLPTDQSYWQQPAIDRLKTEHDETAQKTLLLLLWYAQTEEADQAIKAFTNEVSKPVASRKYAQELQDRRNAKGVGANIAASVSSEAALRRKRRERLKSVSDEALIDLDEYTGRLIAKRR